MVVAYAVSHTPSAHYRPDRGSLREISHRHRHVRARDTAGSALRHGALAIGAGCRSFRVRCRGGLDHPDLHGLYRRRTPLRSAPADPRPLHLRPDHRPAVRAGGRRRARRLAGLAQCLFRAGGDVRARHRRPRSRAHAQSAHPHGAPPDEARLHRRLCRGAFNRWARIVILAVFIEAAIGWGRSPMSARISTCASA